MTAAERQQQIQQLMFHSYGELTQAAYEVNPTLLVFNTGPILEHLRQRLDKYRGPLDDGGIAFTKWASKIVRRESRRYEFHSRVIKEYKLLIHAGIRAALNATSAQDHSVEADDIFNEVSLLIFNLAHALMKPGTSKLPECPPAKLSTRLFNLAKGHTHFYYVVKWERRLALNQERVAAGLPYGVETLSDEELASMNAAENGDRQATAA
jgi:hypothetical protein